MVTGLTDAQRAALIALAERAAAFGARRGTCPTPADVGAPADFPPEPCATFVTLFVGGELKGCIGTIEPVTSVVDSVVHNAYAAGFRDPRFAPLIPAQLDDLDVHISILSPLIPLNVADEDALCEALVPGRDGLVLQTDTRRGTFLPSVWERCPDPRRFVSLLKRKAGIPPDAWPPDMRVFTYLVDEFDRKSLPPI